MDASAAMPTLLSGLSTSGQSSAAHLPAARSQTRSVPLWSAEMSSAWFGCRQTLCTAARAS